MSAIASMNEDNFLVRPHLELVERFREAEAWETLSIGDLAALADRVAKLPDQLDPEHEDAKRFDVLVLNAQLGVLRGRAVRAAAPQGHRRSPARWRTSRRIPVIAEQLELIQDIQADEWWVDVTYPMLEEVRTQAAAARAADRAGEEGRRLLRLRGRASAKATEIELPGTGGAVGSTEFLQFRKKAEHFLKEHLGEAAVAKVRSGAAADRRRHRRPATHPRRRRHRRRRHRSPRPANRPAASGCSSARWSASTGPRRRRRSPTSSTTSATARTRSSSST